MGQTNYYRMMTGIIEQVRTWIEQAISTLGYWGIVLVMAIENIFPPIPSELVMPLAGFLAACRDQPTISKACQKADFTLWGVILAGAIGSVLGALVLYYVGYFANEVVIRRFVRRFGKWFLLSEADLDKALDYFNRHGDAVTFFGRLVPLIRSLISIPAGMARMSLPRFILFTTLGTALWSGLLATAGYFLGQNWEQVLGWVELYQTGFLVVLGLSFLAFIYFKLIHPRLLRSKP